MVTLLCDLVRRDRKSRRALLATDIDMPGYPHEPSHREFLSMGAVKMPQLIAHRSDKQWIGGTWDAVLI